jgi:hypothetical protein
MLFERHRIEPLDRREDAVDVGGDSGWRGVGIAGRAQIVSSACAGCSPGTDPAGPLGRNLKAMALTVSGHFNPTSMAVMKQTMPVAAPTADVSGMA